MGFRHFSADYPTVTRANSRTIAEFAERSDNFHRAIACIRMGPA
jgi:hypothetical protein